MNTDHFRDDGDNPATPPNTSDAAPAETSQGATSQDAANGQETSAANAGMAMYDLASRAALEDAHSFYVRPAQGQGVARTDIAGAAPSNGVSINGDVSFDDASSALPVLGTATMSGSDSQNAYRRAMGLGEGEAQTEFLGVPSVEHLAENPEVEFLPSSAALSTLDDSGGGVVPPSVPNAPSAPAPVPAPQHDHQQDLFAHLGELRSRVLKCVVAVGIAMILTWQYRDALLEAFARPMINVLAKHGGVLTTVSPMEGFAIYLQTTFTAAILLVLPYVLWQVWAFIEPALTHKERRFSGILVPFSVLLFFGGAALGFYLSPIFFEWFFQFQPPHTSPLWTYNNTAMFLAKMLLAFGVCFQVPVVTIFVNKIGLVSRNLLIEYWRHVVVLIFIVVAVITPSWDPVTMTAAALPPCILYGVSIWLVKWL